MPCLNPLGADKHRSTSHANNTAIRSACRLDRHAGICRRQRPVRRGPNRSARRQGIDPILRAARGESRCAQILLPQRGLIERDRAHDRAMRAIANTVDRCSIRGGASSSPSSAARRFIRRRLTVKKKSTRSCARVAYALGDGCGGYCFHALNASAKTRSPGVPFSRARIARRLLL
jgi:hypothetical protein